MTDIDVDPAEVQRRREAGDVQLVVVREDAEWDAGRIAGARHVPLAEVAGQAQTIDRDQPVVFYCRAGSRSAMAAEAFRRAGYDAYSMDGGLLAWADRGLPLEPDGGTVADH
jgi:rhodanese-related sulfurtransferase